MHQVSGERFGGMGKSCRECGEYVFYVYVCSFLSREVRRLEGWKGKENARHVLPSEHEKYQLLKMGCD